MQIVGLLKTIIGIWLISYYKINNRGNHAQTFSKGHCELYNSLKNYISSSESLKWSCDIFNLIRAKVDKNNVLAELILSMIIR